MRALRRKLRRDLWRMRWRALGVVITVAVGVGIYAGIGMAIASGFNTRERLLDRMGFADLEVQCLPEDVANIPDVSRVPGVRAVERRLVLPGTMRLSGGRRILALMVFVERTPPTLDALELVEGGPIRPDDFQSAVVERGLALYQGVRVGDHVRVRVGAQVYESRVDGVAVSPEYLIATANPDYVVPEKGAIGVVFTGLARVSDPLGFTMVNDLLFRFAPGVDRGAVRDAVLARLGHLNLERVALRQEHFVFRFLQLEMEAFQVYAPAIVLTLGMLSVVLTLITMHRLVQDQRQEIGALLALGYSGVQVGRGYLVLGALLGAAGGVLGVGLAFVFRNMFATTYARAMGVPEIIPVVVPRLLAIGCAAAVAVTMAVTALPVWRLLRLPPHLVMREPVRGGVGMGRAMRSLAAVTGLLPLPARFGLRNMLRRPRRTVATVTAIGFSLGVSIAYTVSLTSALQTTERVFAGERWQLAVDFLYPVPLEDLEAIRALPGAGTVDPYLRRFVEIGVGDRFEAAGILGVRLDSGMKGTLIKSGRFLTGEPGEVILSQDLARRLRVGSGERVTIRVRRGREFAFRVAGISGEVVPSVVMMPFDQAQAITEFEGMATGVYLTTSGSSASLAVAVEPLPYVAKVTTKTGVAAAYRKLTSEMLGLVYLATAVSLLVALLLILMSVTVAISERQAEYATLKCLGYGRRRLTAIILAQALGEGGLAALLSVPIGIALAVYLNARVSAAWHEIITIVRPEDVARVLVAVLVVVPAAAYPGLRALERLDIARALAARSLE